MPISNIGRSDVAGLIPEEYSNEFLDLITQNSVCLRTFRTIRMGTKVEKFPILAALPTAGFVDESPTSGTGTKPKSKIQWANKTITAEEVAVIIPIHENVIADSTVDLWAQARPLIAEAFGAVIDDAILFGVGKPSSWRDGLVPDAVAQGMVGTIGAGEDLVDGFNATFAHVESQGHDVSVVYTGPAMRSRLRGLRDENGQLLYADLRGGTGGTLPIFGSEAEVVRNGVWDDEEAWALAADRSRLIAALREDMTYKFLDQATLGTGEDQINLAEKDMVALRVKMRLGWEVATNATRLADEPVPYAVLAPADGS